MIREVLLNGDERKQLERVAKTDPKPYRRERAAAILKVAAGEVAATVARTGLLRRHKPDTLYAWLDRWEDAGIAGLTITPGRGRKPAFSPPDLRHASRGQARVAASGALGPPRVRGLAGAAPQSLDPGRDPAGLSVAVEL